MLETLKNAWRVKEIRNKILFTFMIIAVFRIGSVLPVPFINIAALKESFAEGMSNDFMGYLNILTGGALNYGALFAMGVTPYINSSIIMQLLTVAIPALERMSKEGEEGRKKIAAITRYVTVLLGLLQGSAFYYWLVNSHAQGGSGSGFISISGTGNLTFVAITIILCFTAGTALMMWMGERIDEKGIGNGISILLFSGIISRLPAGAAQMIAFIRHKMYVEVGAVLIAFVAVIAFVIWMSDAERRIPIQYAKRVVGRKQYGGQSTHMPIKVNMSGVMPIIFASSILMLPTMILGFTGKNEDTTIYKVLSFMSIKSWAYAAVYFGMIIAFAYFYTTIQYNPVEMANNLRKNSGAIPGIRPGKPTSDFIGKILAKITLVGALFLGAIAVLPIVVGQIGGINVSLGGTSLLIVVGVAVETVKQLESQMMMRHYKGFLD